MKNKWDIESKIPSVFFNKKVLLFKRKKLLIFYTIHPRFIKQSNRNDNPNSITEVNTSNLQQY